MPGTVHIIGAGLAGLSAAVRLAERSVPVVVHEALEHAGGRCRSYHDHATGLMIDNGNHLLLSGNGSARAYLRTLGSEAGLVGPNAAEFPFIDLASGERWKLRISEGRLPWWIFHERRRVPRTHWHDYLALAPLLWAHPGKTVCGVINCGGMLYERLLRPVLLAALNIEPREGSAALGGAIVRETLAVGGSACRPLIAREGLSTVLIEPALAFLRGRSATMRFRHELRALRLAGDRIETLDFGEDSITLAPDDRVILAVPPPAAEALIPDLRGPTEFRAIVNAHFAVEPPRDFPPMIGVVNGVVEWVFAFPGRLSVTISAADRLLGSPRETLAEAIWREVSTIAGLPAAMPPWQIVRERRATFAATPRQDACRPAARTKWRNLLLAGDWTQTGLPATIEGAIRSGERAAKLAGDA
jgi:squalene-associated FAD-dependent desaturase